MKNINISFPSKYYSRGQQKQLTDRIDWEYPQVLLFLAEIEKLQYVPYWKHGEVMYCKKSIENSITLLKILAFRI